MTKFKLMKNHRKSSKKLTAYQIEERELKADLRALAAAKKSKAGKRYMPFNEFVRAVGL